MFHFHEVAQVRYLGEVDIFVMYVKTFLPAYNSAKIIKISIKIFQSYDHEYTATFLWFTLTVGDFMFRLNHSLKLWF